MTLTMLDSIIPQNLPPGANAYLGYLNGEWPTYDAVRAMFPGVPILSMTVLPGVAADGCDCETGDLTIEQAAEWAQWRLDAGQYRPVVYEGAANMRPVISAMSALGIARSRVRLLSAHYGVGRHICGPSTCGYPQADGTQWTNTYPGAGGTLIDASLLPDNFFAGPSAPEEDAMFVTNITPVKGVPAGLPIPSGLREGRLRFYTEGAILRVDFFNIKPAEQFGPMVYGQPHSVALDGAEAVQVYREDDGTGPVTVAGY